MARAKDTPNGSGGVVITRRTVRIDGDVVGHDKVTKSPSSASTRKREDSQDQRNKPIQIPFLSVNPQDSGRLKLNEAIHGIKQVLPQVEFRDKSNIEQEWAVRVTELQMLLLLHQPDIDFQSIDV